MYCIQCGKEMPDENRFCPACGAPTAQKDCGPRHNHLAYLLLGFFLSGFGIHNFYAGQTGRGIAKVLITVLSMGWLIWVSSIWTAVELLSTREDGNNVPFESPHPVLARILGIILLLPIFAILASMLLPALSKARSAAQDIRCKEQLRKIGVELRNYADDNAGYLPLELPASLPATCPSGRTPYLFFARGLQLSELPENTPLVLDALNVNHIKNQGGWVLFADGSVRNSGTGYNSYLGEVKKLSGGDAPTEVLLQARASDRAVR